MNADKIAIADVIRHPEFGLVSNQPLYPNDGAVRPEGTIRVSDTSDEFHWVDAADCIETTDKEKSEYWHATMDKLET